MHDPARHIIRKATINFRYTGTKDGLKLQQEVTNFCRENLGFALDEVLDQFDQDGDAISIDNLKLDLSLDYSANWKDELTSQIKRQLSEKIHPGIISLPGSVVIKSNRESFEGILEYYLKFGFLPWNVAPVNENDFKERLVSWINQMTSSEIKKLELFLDDQRSLKRFARILNQDDFEKMIRLVSGYKEETISHFYKNLHIILDFLTDDHFQKQRFLIEFNEKLLKHSFQKDPEGMFKIAFEEFISDIDLHHPYHLYRVEITAVKDHDMKMIVRQHQMNILAEYNRKKDAVQKVTEKELVKDHDKKEWEEELKEGTFISNAGAVIIAPFLPVLFSRTGITAGNDILDETAALALVQYCISGQQIPEEYELLLPKVLCGIPPDMVPEMIMPTSEQFTKEADEMLKSIIEYWPVLKDTSIGGLRESFLQRNGKLSFSDDEWQLYVEQKSFDMLLGQIPWNIHLIRLPWMKNALRTHWN